MQLVEDEGRFYGFVQTTSGALFRLAFGNTISSSFSYDVIALSGELFYPLKLIPFNGDWRLITADIAVSGRRLYLGTFSSDCILPERSVSGKSAIVSYQQDGTYELTLKIIAQDGSISSKTKEINVLPTEAPQLEVNTPIAYCQASNIAFGANADKSITNWLWSFGDSNTATGQEVSHQYAIPGTYPITLEVESADGCGQRVTKDITIYEPPEPKFGVAQEVICTNGEIAFQNLTDTQGADELISYAWDFNGEGNSTEPNPSFTFTTGGSKTVSLTASIPGCSNTYDTTFTVEAGPVVNFTTPPQICQGDEVTFENLTTGEGITGYQWTFGDGGTYTSETLESPNYVFDSAGTYIAMLEVNNASGCANTLSKTITIYARPQAAFTADIACAGAPTQFADESTTGINSNVIAWNWNFGDGQGSSQVRNPQYTYALPGTYEASLIVLTSAGCSDTLMQEIIVESAVQANFSAEPLCPDQDSYRVQFTDLSSVNDGEEITEWLWTINGENFVTAEPAYSFDAPGSYQVSLTVFSETACNASVTKNITVEAPPTADFSFALNCAGEPMRFSNESEAGGVAISQYIWDFGGQGLSYEENPDFVFDAAGSYEVSLTLETVQGCRYSISKEITVPATPQAAFDADVIYGGAPLTVNFTNSSTAGLSYLWDFGGAGESTEENPAYTFTEPGTYKVSLQVEDTLGCSDTFSKEIRVVMPVTDLQLQRVSLLSEEGEPDIRLLLTVRNGGTLSMSGFDITLTLDQVLTIHQTFEGTIGPGETINYPLDFSISTQLNQEIDLRYICATLEEKAEDINISNNRSCASLNDDFSVIAPYPNPSGDVFKIDMVLPRQEVVFVRLLSIGGELLQNLSFDNTKAGLNTFTIDVSAMVPGNYILQVEYQEHRQTHRLMVSP
ncbi:PKD domain-containing protein [Catalinimonas niigatensis]|uniref:PKD domain-containing protein n=1 Tax=Catalinimonas niigatensis TaxID=1397264 RepID=UPI00266653E2|nr:PKD domain-containing protein [Catalinimonas niigatensis]WPP52610.1 PKD domain-containing protein [Catalinimonas niigatensis]